MVRKRKDRNTRTLQTKAANYKQLYKDSQVEIATLRPMLAEWQVWASKYKDATTHAYDEATAAREQLQEVEQTLLAIRQIIDYGDRGAATALGQIEEILEGYFNTTRNNT